MLLVYLTIILCMYYVHLVAWNSAAFRGLVPCRRLHLGCNYGTVHGLCLMGLGTFMSLYALSFPLEQSGVCPNLALGICGVLILAATSAHCLLFLFCMAMHEMLMLERIQRTAASLVRKQKLITNNPNVRRLFEGPDRFGLGTVHGMLGPRKSAVPTKRTPAQVIVNALLWAAPLSTRAGSSNDSICWTCAGVSLYSNDI